MKLVIIVGNAAVGKMTVGQELARLTGLRLFHNHMTIEPVIDVFGCFSPPVIMRLREVFFEEFAKTDNYGMIFTLMWAFDMHSDMEYVQHIMEIFRKEKPDAEFYFAELYTTQAVRLERNATENRLRNKASKRDIEASKQRLLNDDSKHRMISHDGEVSFENYMKIDNTNLTPDLVAGMIKDRFGL